MKRLVLGIVLADIALYFWGFFYWGLNPLPYQALRRSTDDAAAGEALRKYYPENGTYLIPGMHNEEAERQKLFLAGPVGILHMTSVEGRPDFDPGIMMRGFLLNTVVVCLIAAIFRAAAGALPDYGSRVKLGALIGLACAFFADLGEVAWWDVGLAWNLHKALYTLTAWVVAALVLANFAAERRNG